MTKTKNTVWTRGRKKLYKTPAELQKRIDEYFKYCDNYTVEKLVRDKVVKFKAPRPYTIQGLRSFLKMVSKDTMQLYTYGEKYEEYHETMLMARAKIEANLVERALLNEYSTGMSIFILANAFGYHQPRSAPEDTAKSGEETLKIAESIQALHEKLRDKNDV